MNFEAATLIEFTRLKRSASMLGLRAPDVALTETARYQIEALVALGMLQLDDLTQRQALERMGFAVKVST